MKISVNFIRQSAIFEVEQSTLISDLKLKIYEKLLVLTSMQSLTYCGHEMRNDLTLSDYDVHDNAVIDLNLKKHVTTSFVRKSVSIGESIPNANTQQQKILNGRHESEPNGVNVPTKSITRRIETAAAVRSQSDMSTDYDPTVHRPIMKVRFNDSNPSISGYYDDSQGYSRGSQEITQEDSEYFEESSRPVDFADVYNISHLITFSGENPLVRLDQAARDADSSSSSLFKNSETTAVPTSVLVPASGSGMASTRAPIAATVAASIRAHALSPPRSTAGKVGISPRRPAPSQSSSASPSSAQPPAPTTSTKSKHSIPTPKKDLLSLRTHYSQLLSDAPATVLQRQPVPTDDDSDFKEALGHELFKEYASCSFYTLLCKYESLRLSLKCALRAHDIQHAKILAAQLTELGYLPRERDGSASDMRLRINTLIMNIRERYDCLAELSDVPGCCVCMDALNEMTDLITDNQEDDEEEYSLCSSYPILCKYEVFNKNIKESLRNRQIDRAKRLKNLLNSLEHDSRKGIIGATAADVKERLKSAEVRLKVRYVSSAERADIDDSIYCSEMLGKVQHLLTEGERATAQAVFESENDTIQPTESSFSGYGQSYSSSSESDDYILHGRSNRELNSQIQHVPAIGMGTPSIYAYLDVSSPIKVSKSGEAGIGGIANMSVKSPSQSYISKYLAASSAALDADNSVLSGKWWLDDGTSGKN